MTGSIEARIAAVVAVAALLAACAGGTSDGPGWQHETIVEGDVTTVRTLSGSVWGGTARLVEEASIGSADGPDEYLIGSVSAIASDGERIYILDIQVPVVRAYDWNGTYLRDIGREGEGPGEYRGPRSLLIDPVSRTLFVGQRDRITMFTPEGEPAGIRRFSSTFSTSRPMVMTDLGDLYMPELLNPGSDVTEWQLGMIHFSSEGDAQNDTIRAPAFDFEPWRIIGRSADGNNTTSNNVPFSPSAHWWMTVDRAMIAGVSTDYRFEVRYPDGRTTVIDRGDWEPVPVRREEADWWRAASTTNMREQFEGWAWNGPEIPGHKPAYSTFFPDESGRIWVGWEGEGHKVEGCNEDPEDSSDYYFDPCWEADGHWDVFRVTGEFLGEVEVPEGFSVSRAWIRDDVLIGRFSDDEGVPYVKRYRMVTPEPGER